MESNPDDETDLFLKIEAETSQTKDEISNSPVCPANDEPLDFGQGVDLLNTQIEELDRAVSDDEQSLTNMQSNEAPELSSSIPAAEKPPLNPFGVQTTEDRDTAKFGTEDECAKIKKHKLVMEQSLDSSVYEKRNGRVN